MTGADRQWLLNRRNFEGRWRGSSHWYLRDGDGVLDLSRPSRVIPETCYAIRFFDAEHGEWDGSGLLFAPEGRRRLALSRSTYNRGGQCWQFEGAGGQSSLDGDPEVSRWGHEINLFSGRSRSMLVLLWGRQQDEGGCRWRLDAIGAVAFRCDLTTPPEPPRPLAANALTLLEGQRGWSGHRETLEPGGWPAEAIPPQPCAAFSPEAFAQHPLVAGVADGLVFSVPEWLPETPFVLQVGCRRSNAHFDQVSLQVGCDRRLQRWELCRFQADD